MCKICAIENKAEPLNLFDDAEIDRVIQGVFLGTISVNALDYYTYQKVASKLASGVYDGFGQDLVHLSYGTPDYIMLSELRTNVYIFSGAKQYQQVREMSALLTNEGKVNSYGDFHKEAKKVFQTYNENYLRTEYNSAIAQARSASMWMEIEKDKGVLPMLQYITAGDGRVRPEHATLNGITRPVDDKFWDIYFPPNDWNCRCRTIQLGSDAEKTSLRGFKPTEANVPEVFRFNAGKAKIIFSNEHPYYKVAPRDKAWAKQNFGLPIP